MKYSLLQKIVNYFTDVFFLLRLYSQQIKRQLWCTLRPHYKVVSLSDVEEMSNVLMRESKGSQGFIGHSTITHNYEVNNKGGKVVIDRATRLMWHQSRFSQKYELEEAKKWVKELNKQVYAGFTDWRLPTLEEAVSLIESSEKNGNQFIDSVFDKTQWSVGHVTVA